MNKTAKAIVSSTLAIGTVFGVGASLDVNPNQDAHAATTPYYNYKGYVNNDGSFLLNKTLKCRKIWKCYFQWYKNCSFKWHYV